MAHDASEMTSASLSSAPGQLHAATADVSGVMESACSVFPPRRPAPRSTLPAQFRLAVVISHPIQHFAPMFSVLAARPQMELKVFYCCDWGVSSYHDPGFGTAVQWDVPLLEGYDYEFLPIARRPESLSFQEVDNPAVGRYLDAYQPDAVWVHGYCHRTSWRVIRWARNRAKVLFFGDSELLAPRPWLTRLVKRLILPRLYRQCDAFITIGDNNEAYYRHYGVSGDRFFRGSFPVDIQRFQDAVVSMTDADRCQVRGQFGLAPDAFVVLFVGKLIPIKRPLDLVSAMFQLVQEVPRAQALIIGSGEQEKVVRHAIRERGMEQHVKLSGFVNQAVIPRVLRGGDVLAMCSDKDPHPLAVTEAMAVGNAIVASDRIGCVGPTDAARPGENTLVYPCGDVSALAGCLARLAGSPVELASMQQASRQLAATQDTTVAADAVERALCFTLSA